MVTSREVPKHNRGRYGTVGGREDKNNLIIGEERVAKGILAIGFLGHGPVLNGKQDQGLDVGVGGNRGEAIPFHPVSFLMVAEHDDSTLGAGGVAVQIFLHNENAHGWKGISVAFTECHVFLLHDSVKGAV